MGEKEQIEKILELRKGLSAMKKTGRIIECFYNSHGNCKGPIKQSHSLQRNGRLSIIEGEVNGNQMIYTFTEVESDAERYHKKLKPIGKAVASTFFGFCDHHDTTLFSPIENFPFDDSDKHRFLHSYRAYAHSYHIQKEVLKASKQQSAYTQLIDPEVLQQRIKGLEIGVAEGEVIKTKFNEMLDNLEYDGLEYLTYNLNEKFPIACSSVISPYFSYKGTPMNNHSDPDIPYSHIMLTVLPDTDDTIVIFACFPDDDKGVQFLDELEGLYPHQMEKAISSLLINCAENTFFAPKLWEALGKEGQRQLCDELELAGSSFYMPSKFPPTKINFFASRFSAKRLEI